MENENYKKILYIMEIQVCNSFHILWQLSNWKKPAECSYCPGQDRWNFRRMSEIKIVSWLQDIQLSTSFLFGVLILIVCYGRWLLHNGDGDVHDTYKLGVSTRMVWDSISARKYFLYTFAWQHSIEIGILFWQYIQSNP